MKIHPGATKRTVLLTWIIAVSLFLYYFSASMETGISLMNFMNFTILLWGGSFAFHITTSLIDCPQTEENRSLWWKLLRKLAKVYIGYVIAGISILIGRKLNGDFGWILAFLGLAIGYIWVMHYIFNIFQPIKDLLNSSSEN